MDGSTDSMDMSLSKLQEMVKDKGSLVGCSPWGFKELDMTEGLTLHFSLSGINLPKEAKDLYSRDTD